MSCVNTIIRLVKMLLIELIDLITSESTNGFRQNLYIANVFTKGNCFHFTLLVCFVPFRNGTISIF